MPSPTSRPPRRAKRPAGDLSAARQALAALRGTERRAEAAGSMLAAARAELTADTHPAEAAELVATALHPEAKDPFAQILAVARQAGYTDSFAEALALRLYRQPEFLSTGRELTAQALIANIDDKIRLLMAHLDPVIVAKMSGKDLVVATAVLIDKKRLLQGEPTQIVDTAMRRSLDELLPAVVQEMRRRGITLGDANRGMIDVTPERGEK